MKNRTLTMVVIAIVAMASAAGAASIQLEKARIARLTSDLALEIDSFDRGFLKPSRARKLDRAVAKLRPDIDTVEEMLDALKRITKPTQKALRGSAFEQTFEEKINDIHLIVKKKIEDALAEIEIILGNPNPLPGAGKSMVLTPKAHSKAEKLIKQIEKQLSAYSHASTGNNQSRSLSALRKAWKKAVALARMVPDRDNPDNPDSPDQSEF